MSCKREIIQSNHFSSLSDTLILKTERIKGFEMFDAGAGRIYFQDTTNEYYFSHVFPQNTSDIKVAFQYIDSKPLIYERYKKGEMKTVQFLSDVRNNKIDTLNAPSFLENTLSIMSGIFNDERVFIVDQNNNKDFRDDSIRHYQKIDWNTIDNLIKCKFNIYNGEKMIVDSTWVNIGTLHDDELLFFVSHHLISTFSIDKDKYQIGIFDDQSNFAYDNPIIALISQNRIKKDSLLNSEMFNIGEYLKLSNQYFRFEDITNDGSLVTLVKEKDVSNKFGTQIGFIAPDFTGVSIDGDSISFRDYKGKYLLLINVTSCWSEIMSYNYYKDLTVKYKGKLEFLGIDNAPIYLQQNIKDLNLSGKFIIADDNNFSIQENYRQDFCSRTCFSINPEGRIVDKFEIFDWKKSLSKHFE